jgi:hypothetical protein
MLPSGWKSLGQLWIVRLENLPNRPATEYIHNTTEICEWPGDGTVQQDVTQGSVI